MRSFELTAATLLLLGSCGSRDDVAGDTPGPGGGPTAPLAPVPAGAPASDRAAATRHAPGLTRKPEPLRWTFQSSGTGSTLALLPESGGTTIRLYCPAGGKTLLVNVPAFRPIGSEERLSLGSGGAAAALVADTKGDKRRGGVSAAGAVPANLAALIVGRVSASYGTQISGPHPAPPRELARSFATACADAAPAKPASAANAGPCMMQGSDRLTLAPLRAVGTEPFWGARIDGRCVTYSHPEDQKGTRIWTRYASAPGGGTWTGTHGGKPFVLRTRAKPGCSDGMSDRRYPIEVELLVGGEKRMGCAAPL